MRTPQFQTALTLGSRRCGRGFGITIFNIAEFFTNAVES